MTHVFIGALIYHCILIQFYVILICIKIHFVIYNYKYLSALHKISDLKIYDEKYMSPNSDYFSIKNICLSTLQSYYIGLQEIAQN